MPVILSERDEMRRRRAIQNSTPNKLRAELQRRIREDKRRAELAKEKEEAALRHWALAEQFARALETLRDAHAPKTPDEEWDPIFRMSLEALPEARTNAKDLWMEYAMKDPEGRG